MAACQPPSQSECSNAFGTCPARNSTYPLSGGSDASNNQTYAQDTSWPGLNTIFVSQTDTSSPSVLVNALPSSVLTTSSSSPSFVYKFSSQDPLGEVNYPTTCQDTFTPKFKASVDMSFTYFGTSSLPPACPNNKFWSSDILTTNILYTTQMPDVSEVQPPDADMSFATTSTPNLFQFFYSGTCPSNTFAGILKPNSLATTSDVLSQASGYTSCSCGTDSVLKGMPFPNGYCNGATFASFAGGSGGVYDRDGITTTVSSYNGVGLCTLSNQDKCDNSSIGSEFGLYANFRDGLTRPVTSSSLGATNCPTATCQGISYHTTAYFANSFQEFASTYRPNTITPFTNMQHVYVSGDAKTPSCKYMMDYCSNKTRGLFLNIQVSAGSSTNINFAQTVQYGGKTYLKSFNIIGRFPGILSGLPSNPTATPEVVDLSTDVFYKLGAVLPGQAGYWNFGVQRFLGGVNPGSTYRTDQSKTCILDTTNKDFANWPDITKVRQVGNSKLYEPDIVVRVVFFNPYLLDPTGLLAKVSPYVPTLRNVDIYSILDFEERALGVMLQNTPDQSVATCDKLFVKSFERGVLMVEYITSICYSLMYGFALDSSLYSRPYFGVNQVYTNAGPYSATNFMAYMLSSSAMNIVLPPKPKVPTLLNPDAAESSSTPSDELYAWLNELQANTQKYFSFPEFVWDSTNQVLSVTLWIGPAMHAHLQGCLANTSFTTELLLAVMLRSFFQDIIPGPNDKAAADQMLVGQQTLQNNFTILTQNQALGADLPIGLTKASQVASKNLVLTAQRDKARQRTYVASYAYTAQVTSLCVGSAFYMLGNSSTFKLDKAWPDLCKSSLYKSLGIFAPYILASLAQPSTVEACLLSNSKSQACLGLLCQSSTSCLCDYSVQVAGLTPSPTPQVETYVNNAWSTCMCLASDSYPARGYLARRADNNVSRAFAFACQGFPDPPYTEACNELRQALASTKTPTSEWFNLYEQNSDLTNALKIVSVCDLEVEPQGQLKEDVFRLNYKVVAASTVLFLAPIVGILAWCAYNRSGIQNLKVGLGLATLCLVVALVASLLVYALSGQHLCPKVDTQESASAGCFDRLTNKVELSDNMCGQTRFCQCDNTSLPCFQDKSVKNVASCTTEGVCTFCPNSTSFAMTSALVPLTTIPTDNIYLGVAAWCFAASILGTLWLSFASRRKLRRVQAWSVFSAILVVLLLASGVGVWLATRNQKVSVTTIDLGMQAQAADQTNPCGS